MNFIIKISSSHKRIIVSANWIKDLSLQNLINYGINFQKQYIVFYSHDKTKVAKFDIPVSEWQNFIANSEEQIDACYIGTIENVFSK